MQTIRVYNLMGTQLKSIVAQKGLNVISLPAGQLYIVKAGSAIQKLIIK
jgi:hypothetical protein